QPGGGRTGRPRCRQTLRTGPGVLDVTVRDPGGAMSRTPRRTFLKQTAAALVGLSIAPGWAGRAGSRAEPAGAVPWYRRTLRWGQTNITEIDPAAYDLDWWRQHWKRTRVQGVIVTAGGIVAYYPSKYPLHSRPPLLGDRDLYGELAAAAH